MRYIDMHCDTLYQCVVHEQQQLYQLPSQMVDLQRLRQADALLQFFAVFIPPRLADGRLEELPQELDEDAYLNRAVRIFADAVRQHPKELQWILNRRDLEELPDTGRLGMLLTIEDGRVLQGRMGRLSVFYDLGVRLITLTWNHANCIGAPASTDPVLMGRGLTDFGREMICRMNALGMLVDVSHLSDGGVQEVLSFSCKPVVASHSCSRFCNPHPRNLSDVLMRALAEKGGVVGLNFSPTFLPERPMTGKQSLIRDMVRHALHMLDVGGEDAVALGSDFDGLMGSSEIASPLEMERLFWQLEHAGIPPRIVEKIAWKNAYRVLKENL